MSWRNWNLASQDAPAVAAAADRQMPASVLIDAGRRVAPRDGLEAATIWGAAWRDDVGSRDGIGKATR